MQKKYTIIWMDDTLNVGVEVYEGEGPCDAIKAWERDTQNCTMIGVMDGEPEILFWQP